jgi:hypothetical protein
LIDIQWTEATETIHEQTSGQTTADIWDELRDMVVELRTMETSEREVEDLKTENHRSQMCISVEAGDLKN